MRKKKAYWRGIRHNSSTIKLPNRNSDVLSETAYSVEVADSTVIAERVPSIGLRVVFSNIAIIRVKYSCSVCCGTEVANVILRGWRTTGDKVVRATAGMTGNRVQTSRWQSIKLLFVVSIPEGLDSLWFERNAYSVAFCLIWRAIEVIAFGFEAKVKTWTRPRPSNLVATIPASECTSDVEWIPFLFDPNDAQWNAKSLWGLDGASRFAATISKQEPSGAEKASTIGSLNFKGGLLVGLAWY